MVLKNVLYFPWKPGAGLDAKLFKDLTICFTDKKKFYNLVGSHYKRWAIVCCTGFPRYGWFLNRGIKQDSNFKIKIV